MRKKKKKESVAVFITYKIDYKAKVIISDKVSLCNDKKHSSVGKYKNSKLHILSNTALKYIRQKWMES